MNTASTGRDLVINGTGLLFLPPLLMILFRQKYPRWWFDWNLQLLRLVNRLAAYLLLLDDRYPATDDEQALVERVVMATPDAVLGLATGSSPIPLYEELGRRVRSGELCLHRTTSFTLDEYIGLPKGHPESYREVISRVFTSQTDADPVNVHSPNGNADDLEAEALSYEAAIRNAGGIDVQILGIGANGHIGFNEPGSSLGSRTRIKTLLPQTRTDNARFFDGPDEVPRHVLTQGIGTIMEAKTIVLMANGGQKAEAVHRVAEGPIAAMCPGSVLQLHPDVRVIIDESAASSLELRDFYRYTYENKPAWQH